MVFGRPVLVCVRREGACQMSKVAGNWFIVGGQCISAVNFIRV